MFLFWGNMNPLLQQFVEEILKPLQEQKATGEYFHQQQSIVEFDRCLRSLENRYAELYEQVLVLEAVLKV